MDFHELLAKMQEIDTVKTEAPVVDTKADECGMPMAPSMPPAEPKDKASMSININAQGDAIDDVMALIAKMKGDMKPEIGDMPSISIMSPGMDGPMDGPEGPPMPKPINKILPDFDGDNDDMPGGEKDMIAIKAMGDEGEDNDYDDDGKLDRHEKDHDDEEKLHKTVDRDDDGDHDMDDHDMEKKDKDEAWANEPDEEEKDIDFMTNKMSGGMNRRKGTHPKVAGGDNPMQRVKEGEDLRASIKQQLLQALEETKGAK
jgi:hypothetical protein